MVMTSCCDMIQCTQSTSGSVSGNFISLRCNAGRSCACAPDAYRTAAGSVAKPRTDEPGGCVAEGSNGTCGEF